ncbi:glycosyltransferase family 4 protein, partial [Actinomyces sp. MRS3W]|uniref:glycosyltransferase family 4 protein n=1 Tax=Actinomyces sp. MRS3W TaxID=2800796 RepID=UPI0028FD9141
PARAVLPAASRLLALPDVVTSVCDYLASPIRAVRGPRETRVVPCIVEPYPPAPRRTRTGDGAVTLRLVSTGGLIDRKDPLLALEIVAELVRRDIDAHLTWVGEGPLHDAVVERASRPDVAGRIELTGAQDAAGVRAALADADIFLGPTKADNFFVSAAEAVVAGRPVVVGATGGQGEYLTPSTGVLVESRDPRDWAEALIDLDRATRDLSAEDIAATIGDAFSSRVVAAGYNAAYRSAVAMKSR